jgi:hypothetical protein
LRCVVGKEDMGNEAERQANDAGAEDERVKKQDVNDAEGRPRLPC